MGLVKYDAYELAHKLRLLEESFEASAALHQLLGADDDDSIMPVFYCLQLISEDCKSKFTQRTWKFEAVAVS